MKSRALNIIISVALVIISLVLGVTIPILVVLLGDYFLLENKVRYFQYSCVFVAFCAFIAQQYQAKAMNLLIPNSSFEPPECYELRQKYLRVVLLLKYVWMVLTIITIFLGGMGVNIANHLINNGLY